MPKTALLFVEVGVYVLAIICLRHAWAYGWSRLVGLVAGMIYGVLIEYGCNPNFPCLCLRSLPDHDLRCGAVVYRCQLGPDHLHRDGDVRSLCAPLVSSADRRCVA